MFLKKRKPATLRIPGFSGEWIETSILGIVFRNWIAQGFLYMNWVEKVVKILVEIVLFVPIAGLILMSDSMSAWAGLVLGFLVAHTLNWLFNGHFFTVLTYLGYKTSRKDIDDYIVGLRKRCVEASAVKEALIYGSFSRKSFQPTSDLDVRIIPQDTAWSRFEGAIFTVRERTLAFMSGIPLDIYMFANAEGAKEMSKDEVPIVLVKKG